MKIPRFNVLAKTVSVLFFGRYAVESTYRNTGLRLRNLHLGVMKVVAYLREQLGVTRLAVHGESIGGVAAASVARHCQVCTKGCFPLDPMPTKLGQQRVELDVHLSVSACVGSFICI